MRRAIDQDRRGVRLGVVRVQRPAGRMGCVRPHARHPDFNAPLIRRARTAKAPNRLIHGVHSAYQNAGHQTSDRDLGFVAHGHSTSLGSELYVRRNPSSFASRPDATYACTHQPFLHGALISVVPLGLYTGCVASGTQVPGGLSGVYASVRTPLYCLGFEVQFAIVPLAERVLPTVIALSPSPANTATHGSCPWSPPVSSLGLSDGLLRGCAS